MRLLLDTHVILWWLSADRRLGHKSRQFIDSEADVTVSTVSVWEISIKLALGKLDVEGDVFDRVERSRFPLLPVLFAHAVAVGRLPHHHRDPFDRMLVAQAQIEGLTIMTSDQRIQMYAVPVLSAS